MILLDKRMHYKKSIIVLLAFNEKEKYINISKKDLVYMNDYLNKLKIENDLLIDTLFNNWDRLVI